MSQFARPMVTREEGGLRIHVPMCLKRRAGRKEIVAPQGLEVRSASSPRAANPFILAVVRAHRWKDLLESGRYLSITALADRLGVNASYVGRHLNLTLLASDIVEAILAGQEPDGLHLGRLFRMPLDWEGQRQLLGMSPLPQAARPPRR